MFSYKNLVKSIFKKKTDLISCYYESGSHSLSHILDVLKKVDKADKIYIPFFICQEVIDVLSSKDIEIKFYNITNELYVDESSIDLSTINDRTIILIINYFGFPANWEYIEYIKNKTKCIIVEDNCHTLRSSYRGKALGKYGDISFDSLRKVLPVLSGSVIRCNSQKYIISNKESKLPNFSQIKYSFRSLRKLSKKIIPREVSNSHYYSGIDVFSKTIHSKYLFDYENIKEKRVANFKFWENFLLSRGLKRILNLQNFEDVIPYVFPCFINTHNDIKKWMEWGYANNIVIIKWPNLAKDKFIGNNSLKNVLLFPVNEQQIMTQERIIHEF